MDFFATVYIVFYISFRHRGCQWNRYLNQFSEEKMTARFSKHICIDFYISSHCCIIISGALDPVHSSPENAAFLQQMKSASWLLLMSNDFSSN